MTRYATRRSAQSSAFRMTIFGALALSLGAFLSPRSSPIAAQNNQDVRPLEPGKPIERELAGGQTHAYQITLAAGQFLHVVAEQRGIDVLVEVIGPGGNKLIEFDAPSGPEGPDTALWVAEAAGDYQIKIVPADKAARPGRYEIKIVSLQVATEVDRAHAAGYKAIAEGVYLEKQKTAASLRQALAKYEEALPLVRQAGNRTMEAATLDNIAWLTSRFGQKSRAVEMYQQSLAINGNFLIGWRKAQLKRGPRRMPPNEDR